jgi:hypothetical protein
LASIKSGARCIAEFRSGLVGLGSKPVMLRARKCFPVCPRKQTSDLRVSEYGLTWPGGREVHAKMARFIAPYRLYHGDACGGERAANPLHCPGIDPELFGNDAHTSPPRSRQGLTDSLFECRSNWGAPKAFTLAPGSRKPGADSLRNQG